MDKLRVFHTSDDFDNCGVWLYMSLRELVYRVKAINLYLRSSLSCFQSRTSNRKTDPYTYLVLKHPHSEAARGFPLTLRHAAEQ
jgi:hypothetical protein